MKLNLILGCAILGGAIAAPIAATAPGCGIARADEIAMPRNQAEFDEFAASLDSAAPAERAAQLNRAGHAFDNGESRLFWFTDLDAARAQAGRENKPILSLRLLGNLSDELSCANSRLFRVLLYPNAEINRQLRENFVLHWSSERSVPVATIDMGDGRILKRTLTGNSAHYLLNADGTPLDVLPGLYAPAEFAAWLQRGADFARDWSAMKADSQPKMLSDWHRGRLIDLIKTRPSNAPETPGEEAKRIIAANFLGRGVPVLPPASAREISNLARPKALGGLPILNGIEAPRAAISLNQLSSLNQLAPSGRPFPLRTPRFIVTLDAATRARIIRMQPSKDSQELIRTLERNIALDGHNNRLDFETPIHAYFVNQCSPDFVNKSADSSAISSYSNPYLFGEREPMPATGSLFFGQQRPLDAAAETGPNFASRDSPYFADGTTVSFDKLNRAIYDKLFRTPASDPWLGLAPADAFVAIRNGGVSNVQSQQRVAQQP